MGTRLTGSFLTRIATRLVRSRVAATTLDEAIARARRLPPLLGTVSFWPDDGTSALEGYRACLARTARDLPDAYLALKVEALPRPDLDRLIEEARAASQTVMFDATGPDSVDTVLARAAEDVGATLPGRWARSPQDAEVLIERGAPVRILEGSRPDPQGDDVDPTRGLHALADRLAGRARRVHVATHDSARAEMILGILVASGTRAELELVDGLPRRRLVRLAQDLDVPVRVTVPYGEPWARYAASRLLRRPWRVLGR